MEDQATEISHTFLQWNIRGYSGNYEDVLVNLSDHNPTVACFHQTMHGQQSLITPRNYTIEHNNPQEAVPGQ